MVRGTLVVAFLLLAGGTARAAEDAPLLLHAPTLSRTQVAFSYGGYLWSVSREGGDARQLTTGGHEGLPIFSPDGQWLAFAGEYTAGEWHALMEGALRSGARAGGELCDRLAAP